MKLKDLPLINEPWKPWKNFYKEQVPNFIAESSTGKHYSEWNKDTFYEYFERSAGQCVSSLRQGYFTKVEQDKIKKNWTKVMPLLQQISNSQQQPLFEVYDELRKVIRQYTAQDRRAATFRLIAGLQPQLLCTVVNHGKLGELHNFLKNNVENYTFKWTDNWFKNSHGILEFYKQELGNSNSYDIMTFPWQTYLHFKNKNSDNQSSIEIDMSENQYEETINLLHYKKQIILQGPPGTGKTREAKEIAKELLQLTSDVIRGAISVGEKISNASGAVDYYTITSITNDSVSLSSDRTTQDWSAPYTEIIEKYEQLKNGQIPANQNGTHPYSLAIAKHLNQLTSEKLFDSQFKLIQFHPSYTYEDFVRGIVAESKGDKIEYKNVNKTLGLFAKEALENYKLSRNNNHEAVINRWVDEKFEEFKADVEQRVEEKMLLLSGAIGIFQVEQDCFRYGVEWQVPSRINFRDFKQIVKAVIDGHLALGNPIPRHISVHAYHRNTYYVSLLNDFFEKFEFKSINSKEREKNYVLIIDEINRANLSSVLGELIYALEYRGKEVNSMYKIEDSEQLVLPPNLYIIGTMNTADRSVGHIDYAIRRRFAFVDILPKDLSDDTSIKFDSKLFADVAQLFDNYLSNEFEKKDVQLGHSYFIDKTEEGGTMAIRLEYEIKPILLEYVKDGILVGENIKDEILKLAASI